MRPDLQAARAAARQLISRDQSQSEANQHQLEQDYDRSLRDMLTGQEQSLRMVCEQQEALRRDMLTTCERQVQLLKAANVLQLDRLRTEMEAQRRRLSNDREAKVQLQNESLAALQSKQKAQLVELKVAMEESLQEMRVEEERKREEALARYAKDLEVRVEAQVQELAKKLESDNNAELALRRKELEEELSILQAQVVTVKATLSTPTPVLPLQVLPVSVSAYTQTDAIPSPAPHQHQLEAVGRTLLLQLDQVEAALLHLLAQTQARTIDLEGRILRVARWKTELEQMAQELD
jgi:hypothetical protein